MGFTRTPDIHSTEQVAGWKGVTGVVYGAGGKIFLQIRYVGSKSPRIFWGALPGALSSLPVSEKNHTPNQKKQVRYPGHSAAMRMRSCISLSSREELLKMPGRRGFDGVGIYGTFKF